MGSTCLPVLLPLLGVPPLLGRVFTADEDVPGENMSRSSAMRIVAATFGGDRGIVGRQISLDGNPSRSSV